MLPPIHPIAFEHPKEFFGYRIVSATLVPRDAHLSSSYFQETVETVSVFGRPKAAELPKPVDSQTEKTEDVMEVTKEAKALTGNSTVPKTGNSEKGDEGR